MPRVALVTGSGKKRVGYHVAEALARRGYSVAVHYHTSKPDALDTVEQFRALGVEAEAFPADLAVEDDVTKLVERVYDRFARVDVLVNAAAIWERKSLEDLAGSLVDGRLASQLAELATVHRAAVVIEERYSRIFTLPHVRPGFIADLLARVQVRWPSVPIFFAETRPLAQEWTYRFLAAASAERASDDQAVERLAGLELAGPLQPAPPSVSQIRAWAVEQGLFVSDRGRLRADLVAAFRDAHS